MNGSKNSLSKSMWNFISLSKIINAKRGVNTQLSFFFYATFNSSSLWERTISFFGIKIEHTYREKIDTPHPRFISLLFKIFTFPPTMRCTHWDFFFHRFLLLEFFFLLLSIPFPFSQRAISFPIFFLVSSLYFFISIHLPLHREILLLEVLAFLDRQIEMNDPF